MLETEKRSYEISLVDVLNGDKVKDIYGYVSHEFGDAVFKITRIVTENGKSFYVEGEHDLPYIAEELELPEGED